jgi:hypothetical protein
VDEQTVEVQTETQPEVVAAEVTEQVEEAQDKPANPALDVQAILDEERQ